MNFDIAVENSLLEDCQIWSWARLVPVWLSPRPVRSIDFGDRQTEDRRLISSDPSETHWPRGDDFEAQVTTTNNKESTRIVSSQLMQLIEPSDHWEDKCT